MLGIVGDSAAGKTTFSAGVMRLLGPERVGVICTDDYHRYDRQQRSRLGITPLHPDCNHLDIMRQHITLLARGEPVLKPVYDHATGTFAAPEYVGPTPFMVAEGLLGFSSKSLRDCFTVKVFLAPPEELRRAWKISRDCSRRGYRPEQVVEELARREHDSAAFIRPQRGFSDVVISFEPAGAAADGAHLNLTMFLRPTISHRDITAMVEKAIADGCGSVALSLGRDEGSPVDIVEVSADIPADETERIAELLWNGMRFDHHLAPADIGGFVEGNRACHSDTLAVAQLFVAYHLLSAAAAGLG